jgi:KaiC/GvpD/RAD55 family RecA-like ATPase
MSQAIDKGVSVEIIERLLAIWEKIRAQAARKAYFDSLREFQAECPIIEKDTKVYDKYGNLRYKYAKLEKIISIVGKLLSANGFSYSVKPIQKDNRFTAVIVSTHKDGHTEETPFEVPINDASYMTAPQKVGEARTYALRGAFIAAYGIMTADGDTDADDLEKNAHPITGEKDKPPKKEKSENKNNGAFPPENASILKEIMALVREEYMGEEIFPTKEQKEKIGKQANGVKMDLEAITAQRDALVKVANQRREAIQAAR